jgi:uncharacterized membrane protein YdbT with pleckstrin-like domain
MAARKLRGIQFDSPDEVEVFHAKESWIPVILGGIPFILLGIAALVVAWWLFKQQAIGLMLLGAFIVVAVLSRIPRILANLDTDVVITNKRLYARTGIVDIKDQVCDLSNISDVTVDPSVLGRIFDYANVRVQTFAGDQDFDLRGIAHPYEMRKAINRGSDAVKEPRASRRHETRR